MVHPVDKYVGSRVRLRRAQLGITQQKLGEAANITFQQIQKYERGVSRISVSKLYEFSKFMNIAPEWFLEGYVEIEKGK